MEIRLPHLPFKFDTPEGRMEVTVRRGGTAEGGGGHAFVAGLSFIEAGPRALERILLSAKSDSYGGAIRVLTVDGFKVNPSARGDQGVEYRVLTALCETKGVVDVGL